MPGFVISGHNGPMKKILFTLFVFSSLALNVQAGCIDKTTNTIQEIDTFSSKIKESYEMGKILWLAPDLLKPLLSMISAPIFYPIVMKVTADKKASLEKYLNVLNAIEESVFRGEIKSYLIKEIIAKVREEVKEKVEQQTDLDIVDHMNRLSASGKLCENDFSTEEITKSTIESLK